MSFDTINAWPNWAHITEEEVEQLGSALHKAQVLEFRASWFAKAIFGVEPLTPWETPQHKLQEIGCPVSSVGLNDEQARDKALVQWWVLQGTPNDTERERLTHLVDKWHQTMVIVRPTLRMRDIGVHLKKYVDKHGLVEGAHAMFATPYIGKMELIYLQLFTCPSLWAECQHWIQMFRIEQATTAPLA